MKKILMVVAMLAFAVNAFAGDYRKTTVFNSTGDEVLGDVSSSLKSMGYSINPRALFYGVVYGERPEKELTFSGFVWRDETFKMSECMVEVKDDGKGTVTVKALFVVKAVFTDGTVRAWKVTDPNVYNAFFSIIKNKAREKRDLFILTENCLS